MGLRMFLFAPALLIMLVSIMLGGANNQGAVQGSLVSNSSISASFCSPNAGNACVAPGTSTVITCTQNTAGFIFNLLFLGRGGCQIAPNCIQPPPAPSSCAPFPFNIVFHGTYLPVGDTVILNAGQVNQGLTTTAAIFNFAAIGPAGWITIAIAAVGLAALASIAIAGSGLGNEGVHILILGGLVVGIWAILSAMDGFVTGNPNSLFSSLNAITMHNSSQPTAGIGTFVYIICSIFWTFGFVGLLDRGGG